MTTTQASDPARAAMTRGLLASGINVDGVMAGHNPTVAADMFKKATQLDAGICDAWLARIVAGDDNLEVVQAAWDARESYGREIQRLSLRGTAFRPMVSDGVFLKLEITSRDALRAALAVALIREKRYAQAHALLSEADPADPFDADSHLYARGLLHFQTKRWPGVLATFSTDRVWRLPIYGAAASAMAATALASLGVFEDAFRRAQKAVDSDLLPAAATIALYTQAMCLRHLDKADDANQLLRRAYSRDAQFAPAREALDDQTIRLLLTSPEAIESRTDPWDPDSAPSKEAAEAAKHSAVASKLLAEGDAELNAMLGMEAAKREVKRIRSTTKVNQLRTKAGLPVPVSSRHTLLLGPPGTGKTTVARSLTKQLCGLGVLRRPTVVETRRSKLLGRHMGDAEKNTEATVEGAMGGALFIDEMHNLYETGYSGGDAYGTAILETLLPYLENDRAELVVFGAGYPNAMDRMLTANQGLRRRFPTVIRFESYTPDELWQLTELMASEYKDVLAEGVEATLRPVFERFYVQENRSPDGDVIRGTDWLGNAGFVRNIIEKARDHRNNRLDTEDLDALLAQDDLLTEAQLLPFQQLIAEDVAEGVAAAVSDAESDRNPLP
ncbi:secretion protein EccA [Mycolicibacterium aromaticivorans JS19b1 = JCM 16368]|uniref:Secretion protein EccA n=1 Tax=Mycolicibacterium aromaticivorans JS19b1 = JCM 16368 TaxID=1440774 RepID=A0A064CEN4_9MYCO|nr:type VII secretion AAA-ATPase EccA [Mycolicibacterium aromaticivorans]KDE97183.1 secretion protein EccA [Mycolicibacterium aromaticivorans JS19b1 = JCM 16368]